jgi:hypothetical protein
MDHQICLENFDKAFVVFYSPCPWQNLALQLFMIYGGDMHR